jgi:hypothetical protein
MRIPNTAPQRRSGIATQKGAAKGKPPRKRPRLVDAALHAASRPGTRPIQPWPNEI